MPPRDVLTYSRPSINFWVCIIIIMIIIKIIIITNLEKYLMK